MKNKQREPGKWTARIIFAAAVVWACWSSGNLCRSQTLPANASTLSPDLREIMTLSRQHMDDSVITNYIISTGKAYKLSADDIIYLNRQGVSQAVISALLRTASAASTNSPTPDTLPTQAGASATNAAVSAVLATSAATPVPPPLEAAAPPPAATATVPVPDVALIPPAVPLPSTPAPTPTQVTLHDTFYAEPGLNPIAWQTQSTLLSSLAAQSGVQIVPTLTFTRSGMQMSGIGGPGQFMGIQSTASFVPPFTFSTTVSGMAQSGTPFEIYLVSSDLQQWVSVAGHLGGRAVEREGVRVGLGGLFRVHSARVVSTPDYGFWINHTGDSLPISALGYKLAADPLAGVPYTVQISAGADGAAAVSLLDASGRVLAAETVPVGMGPFYVVLAGRDGPTFATWQSVQLTPAMPAATSQSTAVALPEVPATPTFDYFQAQLAPYGNWITVPGYGLCWEPAVAPDWRPYYDGGHWEYTDVGWYWQSDYPWGDITFHYGRWTYANLIGGPAWIWVPGYDYAPSWVVWQHDDTDGYIGWAPLPPGAVFVDGGWEFNHVRVRADFTFGLGAAYFTFVDYNHLFFDPHSYPHGYRHFIVPHDRLAAIYGHSVVINHYNYDHGRFVNEGMARDRMVVLTHRDIRPVAMQDLRHQEEFHNAMVRRDDIHHFNPGPAGPDARNAPAPRPEDNHYGPDHSNPDQFHDASPDRGQNHQDHGNNKWH